MLSRVRYFASDVGYWLTRSLWRPLIVLAALALLAGAGLAGYLIADTDEPVAPASPAPQIVVAEAPEPEATEELGFPAFATRNTTRVAGPDPVADAAGVALAVHPSTGGVPGPDAVTLVDAADWHGGIAAASLVGAPVGAPILVTAEGEVPELTAEALAALAPGGSEATGGNGAFQVGAAVAPEGLDALAIEGRNPAGLAAEIEQLRADLAGDPDHIVLASSDQPEYAMPAASWAARSGDPVLFVQQNSLPAATRQALRRNRGVPVYVLGPPSVVSQDVLEEIRDVSPGAQRIAGDNPVTNAIEFARYADGSFGWNINDPGHGLVIASVSRPLDAAAAAPLSAAGTWGPLLVTEDGAEVPQPLRAYLLDLKPGYEDDPTRAVYNRVWVIGDTETISVAFQAEVDELVELAPVRPGRGPGAGRRDDDADAGLGDPDPD